MIWLRMVRQNDIRTFWGLFELLIFTDFSSTVDLFASQTDNSSQNAHAVLAIFVVLSNRRDVRIKRDGRFVTKSINDCDVWYFFGDTISKGKKNDHVFHNACLEEIVRYYQNQRRRTKMDPIEHIRIWTDNCAGQYKCRYNFLKIATFPERVEGVRVSHRFAQKYDFKGVWDAAGKVFKDFMRKLELKKKHRFATAFDCFEKSRNILKEVKSAKPWDVYEKDGDPQILEKRPFMVTRRFFGFGTEDKDEAVRLGNRFRHIVHTDRESIPSMAAIEGTQKLHSVGGSLKPRTVEIAGKSTDEWKLLVASMPCACLSCRHMAPAPCPFKHIRQEREIWVSEQRERTPRSTEHDDLYERVKRILKIDKLTKAVLIGQLRLRSQSASGNKDVLAKRLLQFENNLTDIQAADPPQLPLASTFISNDAQLDYDDSDEE
jgi:hypothetical protein